MSPLFSVVVPVYNIENYIENCILSVLNQTFTDFELILVDDGSSDRSPDICDKYSLQDSRIKVIHKENGGVVSARQAGVVDAVGEYIACVDGDDWISIHYLERFAEVIQQYRPDIACCGAIWAYENKEVRKPPLINTGYYDRKRIKEEVFPILIERSDGVYLSPSQWAKVFKYELFQTYHQLVSTSLDIGEDIACVKPCIYHSNSMYVMADCLYYYRQNPASITKKRKAFNWDGPQIIGEHLEKQIDMKEFDFQEQVYRNVVHNLFNVAVSQFNRNEPYYVIVKEIKENIRRDYYKKAIEECRFSRNLKGFLAWMALKYRLIPLMYLYNRLLGR